MGCTQSMVIEVSLADGRKGSLESLNDSRAREIAAAVRQFQSESSCGSFEPLSVDACTAVDVEDAVSIADMRTDSKKRRVRGTNSCMNLAPAPAAKQQQNPDNTRGKGFFTMQATLPTDQPYVPFIKTSAAGIKHIGYGPLKAENQDEFFIQIGSVGGEENSNMFCIFDGHGGNGMLAAKSSAQHLTALLDKELRTYYERSSDAGQGLRGALEVIISEAFAEAEKAVSDSGVDLTNSGTTAAVAVQRGNQLWLAAAGDSRALLCSKGPDGGFRAQPLSLDHRPSRPSETARVVAAGARVQPQRLPSGRLVGEPRMWLRQRRSPGLLISRSLGDLMASTVGCTSEPEVSFTTLRPHVDQFMVLASDGVWDVLPNELVCDLVTGAPDINAACQAVVDAALKEWEQRQAADNISVVVVRFEWDSATPAGSYSHIRSSKRLPSTAEEPSQPLQVHAQGSAELCAHLLSVRSAPSGSSRDSGPPSPSDIPQDCKDQPASPAMPRVHAPFAGRSRLLSKGARQAARGAAPPHSVQAGTAASGPSSPAGAGAASSEALLAPASPVPVPVAVKG